VNLNLFENPLELQRIDMPDADVAYLSEFTGGEPKAELLQHFLRDTPWRAEKITVWGKTYDQPRLIAWYGDPEMRYDYSGVAMDPLSWTAQLLSLKRIADTLAGTTFNSVLLNYYRDHRDSMGLHSDSEPELGLQPGIASFSLGEMRTLIFKHRTRRDLATVRIPLESGSWLIMKGDTQSNWKHGINKQSRPCGPRVNLTFRKILRQTLP
jgi:alkylated DNA repair dioxygenase AlkB